MDGQGRGILTILAPVVVFACVATWWPADTKIQESILKGLQAIAFVAAAFAVTAYNLRTRVIDLVLKIEGKPSYVADFCGIARRCGKRLTNLVILFVGTATALGVLAMIQRDMPFARFAAAGAVALFSASVVSFFYIVFSFERLERYALDSAEKAAQQKEADRLLKPLADQPAA